MGDKSEDEKETYEDVKATVAEVEEPDVKPEEVKPEEPVVPKTKAKAKAKEAAKPAKLDKVECADCGKTMTANALRYKHVCKPPKSEEIQREKPRKIVKSPVKRKKSPHFSPSTPRTKMVQYYREARVAQEEQKRARYRGWLGND